MFVCVPAGGLWRCDRVLDRSRRAMSVSVSRIGQSFDRSVNRLVDQSISHDSLVSLLINHSVSVGACTHLPALAPLVRSGCPLYSYTYIIYTMMLPNFFLTWPSSKKKREKKDNTPRTNPSTYELPPCFISRTCAPFPRMVATAWSVPHLTEDRWQHTDCQSWRVTLWTLCFVNRKRY